MSDQVPRSSKRLRRMASVFEQSISPGRSEQIAARALARARAGRRIGRRVVPVLVTGISIFLLFVVALGVTAASSLPGDALYGVSRAYEEVGDWVGVVDPVERRLQEVIALADRGDAPRAALAAEEALVELLRTTDITFNIPAPKPESDSVASSSSSVTAAADQIQSLRIAAELLLSNVNSNGSDLEAAAAGLADAVSDLGLQGGDPSDTTTSTTLPEESSTTTTLPESTTTTIPGSSTTTVPGDDDGSGGDEDPGPIFLPPGS